MSESINVPNNEGHPHLAHDASASSLNIDEVTKLLENCSNRKEKFSLLTLLYARIPDIKKVLSEEFNYTPNQFTSHLNSSADELLTKLPRDYVLMPSLKNARNKMYVNIEIVSSEAEKEYYSLGDRNSPFDEYVNDVSRGEPSPGAGYTVFTLKREKVDGITFNFVHGERMKIVSKNIRYEPDHETPGLKKVTNKKKVTTPLLRSQGGKFSVSDEFIHMQESLVKSIARDTNGLGIGTASFLSSDGRRMRIRNGYVQDYLQQIPNQYRAPFEKTIQYNFLKNEYDGLAKIIHVPTTNSST